MNNSFLKEWIIKPIWAYVIIILITLVYFLFIAPKPDISMFIVTYRLTDYTTDTLTGTTVLFVRTPSNDTYVMGLKVVNSSNEIGPLPPILFNSEKLIKDCGVKCFQNWISLKNNASISAKDIILEIDVDAEETIDGDRDFIVNKVPKPDIENVIQYQFTIPELEGGTLRSISFQTRNKPEIIVNKCYNKEKSYSCKIEKFEIDVYESRTEFMIIDGVIIKKPESIGLFMFDKDSSKWIFISDRLK